MRCLFFNQPRVLEDLSKYFSMFLSLCNTLQIASFDYVLFLFSLLLLFRLFLFYTLSFLPYSSSPFSSFYFLVEFFIISCNGCFFHWILRDSKTPQISRRLQSIQVNFCCVVVWMLSIILLISSSSSLFSDFLRTVPRAPTTIGITVTNRFHKFFGSRSKYLFIILFYFIFVPFARWNDKIH